MEYVIGCDIGSQSVKSILLSAEGRLAAEASSSYGIDYPFPTWAEQPAEAWLEALQQSVRVVMAKSGVSPGQVRGMSLAAQVDGVVPLGRDGKALRQPIIWMDRRAVRQCQAVEEQAGSIGLFQLTGLNLDPSHVAAKIRWLHDEEADIYREASAFLMAGSFVAYTLTGELGVDYSNASSTMLMDVRRKAWSGELCQLFEIDPQRLAPIYAATQVLGGLLPGMAEALGLEAGLPVVLGSGDEHAACLGAGVLKPGLVCDIAGTAEPVCAASAVPVFDPSGLVETHCHAHPAQWLLENPGFVSGANYRWFREHFGGSESQQAHELGVSAYDLLNDLAATAPPGSDGLIFLPCLMGAMTPTWNAAARGVYFGFTLAHSRAHFVRSLLEASAYAVRDITDQMRQIGLPLQQICVVGGGARSRLWRQIKANVSGLPVALPQTTETTALGAAMLALVGVGLSPALEDAAQQVVQFVETLEPDPQEMARYEDYYQLYRAAYFAALPVFEQAARIPPGGAAA